MDKWKVTYFVSASGTNPVKDFLDVNLKAKVKALRIFSNIEEYGLASVIPHIKKLAGTPLWEIRILGEDSVRILYVTRSEKQILLLHAFVKKTYKTPLKEINVALKRLREVNILTEWYLLGYHIIMKTYTFRQHLKESLKDPEFRKAWEDSEAEYQISRALISARIDKKISQRELAKRANTTQAVISRLESMSANPSIGLIQKIASALNLKLKIQLIW